MCSVYQNKGGLTVKPNEKGKFVPTRLVIGWRVCMDYQKLNLWMEMGHFPMPFMDQMLHHLCVEDVIYFWMVFRIRPNHYFPIISRQNNSTFSFGLCNAPATF